MRALLPFLLVILFASCEFHAKVKEATDEAVKTSPKTKIRNGIKIKSTGLNVSQAFLVYEDGTLVPPENNVKVNQELYIRLIIDSGWKVENGKVSVGAAEKVMTSDATTILDEADLFSGSEVVDAKDASVIVLKVVINRVDKLYDYYQVNFRVWDKKGNGEITGDYRFHIQ